VCTTGDELGNLFSNSFALEQLELIYCGELISLKIPFWLERLSFLRVSECNMLQVIESKAPNLHTLALYGDPVHLTLGESSQVKTLDFMLSYNWSSVSYAITKLPSTVPTLETLTVTSSSEVFSETSGYGYQCYDYNSNANIIDLISLRRRLMHLW
jgi:hypothetical protein